MTVIDVIILTPPQSSKQLGLYLSVHGSIAWRGSFIRSGSFLTLFIVLLAPEHLRRSSWGFHWRRTIIKCDRIIHVFIPSVLWEVRLRSCLVIFDPKKITLWLISFMTLWRKIARYFFAERTAMTLNDLFCLERQTLETRSKCHTFKRSPVWNKETQNTGIDLMNVSKWSIKWMAVASGVRSLKSAKGLSEIHYFFYCYFIFQTASILCPGRNVWILNMQIHKVF